MSEAETNLNKLKEEAYRLSELSLSSDAAAADRSDARAMGFCGVVIAGAAILTGLVDGNSPNYGLLLAAFVMAVSAGLAGYSARPRDFYFPGARFDDLDADLTNLADISDVIEEIGRFNDKHSRQNRQQLRENAKIMTYSYLLAMAGLLIAIGSQFLSLSAICPI
jgi:hypothetical protein